MAAATDRRIEVSLTGIAFLLAFTAGCLMALARHPIYGLVTYIAVFYLHPPSRWWGEGLPDLRWSLVAAAVTLLAVIIHSRHVDPIPLFRHRLMLGLMLFLVWIAIQWSWAINLPMHQELVVVYAKYLLLVGLIYKCIDSQEHLRLVIWAHIIGCLFLGTLVLESYLGGRFEGFGGPDINEANAGAMQVVTGIAAGAAMFLAVSRRARIALFVIMPLIVNALIATISRSGFLALAVTGFIFNLLAPKKYRRKVRVLSVLALALFMLVANPVYWSRIASISYFGDEVVGVDTGAGRFTVIEAQWEMFQQHPMGCGHRCTATLSRYYLDEVHLTGVGDNLARSSHNTFMTMLVEQGVPGALFYLALAVWVGRKILELRRSLADADGFLGAIYAAVAASLVAILIGDLFVDYLKLEVRIWFLAFLMVIVKLNAVEKMKRAQEDSRSLTHAGWHDKRVNQVRISAGTG